jgi:hypothetical protein
MESSKRIPKNAKLVATDLLLDGEPFPYAFAEDSILITPTKYNLHRITIDLIIDGPVEIDTTPAPPDA